MIARKYPHLFSPLKVGPLTLKNRIEAAPTSVGALSPDGYLTRENIAHYKLKARGGAAVVTIGAGVVHAPTGRLHPSQIPLYDKGVLPSLVEAADAIHQYGALASIEFFHGGMEGAEVGEMPEALLEEIAEAHAEAAATVKLAGFDMCMIHAAHGWLLAQFLSPLMNKRTDKYGGSLDDRARFPLMVIDRVRERVGKDFPIELRMGGSELAEGGYTIEDAVAFAQMAESKVDLLHVSAGSHYLADTLTITHPSMFEPHGRLVHLAEAVKKAVDIPVVVVGGLSDPAQMEQIIADGQADVVAVARGLLADPYLPKKALHGRDDNVVPCLRCFECLGGLSATSTIRCAVNPIIGRELDASFQAPTSAAKKVLIVGGGPAGMQAAITAAERGHDVMLCEITDSLGGALKYARGVAFKQDLDRFRRYLIRKVMSLPIGVILNMEVDPEAVEVASPDVLIASVGADPIVPDIPGVDLASVIPAEAVHWGGVPIGRRVVVIGGGQMGCETGLHLAQQGKDVTIVEMLDEVASDSNPMHRRALLLELAKAVTIRTGLTCTEITGEGVVAAAADGEQTAIPADTVVIAVGYSPRTEVVDALAGTAPEFMTIGDCVRPRRVLHAIRMGYDAGMAV